MSADERGSRILVGRKGSGKTIYMKRLRSNASMDLSIYADHIQQDVPTTSNIIKFCKSFPDQLLTEQWMELWHRAVIRSLISHLLCNAALAPQLSNVDRQLLIDHSHQLIRSYSAYVSVYSQINEIIGEHHSQALLDRFLSHPNWAELETVLSHILRSCRPVSLYLDAADEKYSSAPMYWLRCQKGLFYQTMRLSSEESELGRRLYITFSMRDVVFASICRDEGSARFRGEPHIRVLSWNRDAIKYFLHQKIDYLDGAFMFGDTDNDNSTASWLGVDAVPGLPEQPAEVIDTYLLRHTRLLPRDIVILGNMLCHALSVTVTRNNRSADVVPIIMTTVERAARIFGNEQLTVCASELAANNMDALAVAKIFSKGSPTTHITLELIRRVIAFIGVDRFSFKRLKEAQSFIAKLCGVDLDVFSVMWTNGLVGYVDVTSGNERHMFYADDRMDEFSLPLIRKTYIFHPIVVHAVGLRLSGKAPVVPE